MPPRKPRNKLLIALTPLLLAIPVILVLILSSGSGDPQPRKTSATEALYKSAGQPPQTAYPTSPRGAVLVRPDKIESSSISYSRFLDMLDKKKISDALVVSQSSQIHFLRSASGKRKPVSR